MGRHHVEVSQLSIVTGGDQPKSAPYMNVTAKDYEVLGVVTHMHGQVTAIYINREGLIGLFAFPTQREFEAYSATRPGKWTAMKIEDVPA